MTASRKATHIILRPYLRLAGPLFRHTLCEMSLPQTHRSRTRRRCTDCRKGEELLPVLSITGKETIRHDSQRKKEATRQCLPVVCPISPQNSVSSTKKPKPTRSPCYPRLMLFASNSNGGPKLKLSALFNGFQGSTSVRTTRLFSQSP